MLIAGVCGLVAFAVYGQVAQTRHLDAQVTSLSAQNQALTRQISDREQEIADAQTVAWLEEEARQLGYVFPGEHLYVIVPPGGSHSSTGGVSVPIPTFKVIPAADPQTVADAEDKRVTEPEPEPRTDPDADPDTDAPLRVGAPRRRCHVRYPLRAAWSSGSSSGS